MAHITHCLRRQERQSRGAKFPLANLTAWFNQKVAASAAAIPGWQGLPLRSSCPFDLGLEALFSGCIGCASTPRFAYMSSSWKTRNSKLDRDKLEYSTSVSLAVRQTQFQRVQRYPSAHPDVLKNPL